jgi:hypothetical protein
MEYLGFLLGSVLEIMNNYNFIKLIYKIMHI